MKKKAVKHDQLCPFDDHTVYNFLGKVVLELLSFIAECVTNIENKTNLTSQRERGSVYVAFIRVLILNKKKKIELR